MTTSERECLRIEILNFLAIRHSAAFDASQIANRLRIEQALGFKITDQEVNDECGVLVKLGFLSHITELGFEVVPYYQASGKGIIESERWREKRGLP